MRVNFYFDEGFIIPVPPGNVVTLDLHGESIPRTGESVYVPFREDGDTHFILGRVRKIIREYRPSLLGSAEIATIDIFLEPDPDA